MALDALGPSYPFLLAGWRGLVRLAALAGAGVCAAVAFLCLFGLLAEVVGGGMAEPAMAVGSGAGFVAFGLAAWWLAGGRPDDA